MLGVTTLQRSGEMQELTKTALQAILALGTGVMALSILGFFC